MNEMVGLLLKRMGTLEWKIVEDSRNVGDRAAEIQEAGSKVRAKVYRILRSIQVSNDTVPGKKVLF